MHMKAITIAALAAIAGATLAQTYQVVEIAPFSGGTNSRAFDVNDFGNVVGDAQNSAGQNRAFFYDLSTGQKTAVPVFANTLTGTAWGLNDSNMVVGHHEVEWQSNTTRDRAWWWMPGQTIVQIPNFSASTSFEARAYEINEDGVACGQATGRNGSNAWQGFTWTGRGGTVWRGTLTGSTLFDSGLYDINGFETTVGFSDDAAGDPHGIRIPSGGAMVDLGILSPGFAMWMRAVNDTTQMVGVAQIDFNTFEAVRKNGGGSTFWLGKLPGSSSDDSSQANDINANGSVVGECEVGNLNSLAVIHNGSTWVDLNTRIPAGSGWVLRSAQAISDTGYIAGYGEKGGATRAFLLRPMQTIQGFVELQDFGGDVTAWQCVFMLYDPATNALKATYQTPLSPSGQYSFQTPVQGTFRLTAKMTHWLAKQATTNVTLTQHGIVTRSFSLPNGDITGDNAINLDDFLQLASNYELPELNDLDTDLNGDGACNLDDFLILAANYETVGD